VSRLEEVVAGAVKVEMTRQRHAGMIVTPKIAIADGFDTKRIAIAALKAAEDWRQMNRASRRLREAREAGE